MAADKELVSKLTTGGYIVNFITNTDRKGASNLTFEVLEQRKELLYSYLVRVEARHLSLSQREQALKDQAYFKDHLFFDYGEAFINAKAELTRRMRAIRPDPGARSSTSAALQISSQLPKIALPTFTGNQQIGERSRLSSAPWSKMYRTIVILLNYIISCHDKTCLGGDAARRLNNIEVVDENFVGAWDTLIQRYDNQRVRLSAHMCRRVTIIAAISKSARELNRLQDVVTEAVRAMKMMGRPVDKWDDWFVELIASRLDPSTREDWEKSLEGTNDFRAYEQITTFIDNRARSLEAAHTTRVSSKQSKFPNPKGKSVLAHHAASEDQPPRPSGACSQYQGRHTT